MKDQSTKTSSDPKISFHSPVWDYLTSFEGCGPLAGLCCLSKIHAFMRCFLPQAISLAQPPHIEIPPPRVLRPHCRYDFWCVHVLVHVAARTVAHGSPISTARGTQKMVLLLFLWLLTNMPFQNQPLCSYPQDSALKQGQRWRISSCVKSKLSSCLD